MNSSKTVTLFSQPYLDTYNQCYKNIVTVNTHPHGPLEKLVRRIQLTPLSVFKEPGPCTRSKNCCLAIQSMSCSCRSGCGDLMSVDEVPNLISFLLSNGYKVDTSITKMFNASDIKFNTTDGNKLICFITFTPLNI